MTSVASPAEAVAVVHPNLSKGGSGAVCLNVLEALQHQYDVTLVTDTKPDFEVLNDFFGTNVDDVEVRTLGTAGATIEGLATGLSKIGTIGLDRLRKAVLTRSVARSQGAYDVILSTKNELSVHTANLQYFHTPKLDRTAVPGLIGNESPVQPLYDAICDRIARLDPKVIKQSRLLANSEWTARQVKKVYDVPAEVVYPPVNTAGFDPKPWDQREPGFVTVGRIARNKKVEQAADIVARLREIKPNLHLHLVGPTSHQQIRAELESTVGDRDFIHVEGELPRSELLELVCSHRFGLHTKPHEPFGIAVAELVAGGCLTFVPDTGGPGEIVGHQEALQFGSTADAVEKIERVLAKPELRDGIRAELPDVETWFGRERFHDAIRNIVAEELNGSREE